MRALRHPALGLVLVIVALQMLPGLLSTLSMLLLDFSYTPVEFVILIGAQVLAYALQLATGWAMVRGRPAGRWFAGYFGACVALSITAAVLVRGEDAKPSIAIASALETLGFPVLVAIASMLRASERLPERRAVGDGVAALAILALRILLVTPLDFAKDLGRFGPIRHDVAEVAGMAIVPAITIVVASLALVAAVRLAREPQERGWRALRVYVVAAIATRVALFLFFVIWTLVDDGYSRGLRAQVVVPQVVGLLDVLVPITIWRYVRAALGDSPHPDDRASLLPLWTALTFVPTMLARPFVAGTLMAPIGGAVATYVVLLCMAEGTAILGSAHAAMRGSRFVRWWTLVGALGGVVILAAGAYYVLATQNRFISMGAIAPLGSLAASTVVAAWLHRRSA